jgi:hypothetical protein
MKRFRRNPALAVFTIVLVFMLTACGASNAASVGGASMTEPAMAPEMPAAAAVERDDAYYNESGQMPAATAAPAGGDAAALPADRLIIKNGYLTVQVEQVDAAEAALRARAEQLGGYVVSVNTYGYDENKSSTLTVRVPADQFEAMLSDVEGLAREVISRNVSGDDVTQEYVDLESQLRNEEATRDRLLELLERATRVEDALQVNQALGEVQGRIEIIQGRMKYLSQSAAMSTLTIELQPVPPLPTVIEDDAWQPFRTALSALSELVVFFQALADVLIVIAVWIPIWLPIVLLLRWLVRRAARHRPPTPPTPPTPPAA